MRTAKVVTTSTRYPSLHVPFITPLWNDGPDIHFTMSVFASYGGYLFRTTLEH